MHPRSAKKWDAAVKLEGDFRAKAIDKIFKDTRKGDFAQVLAERIEAKEETFTVPGYIAQAIKEVVA